MQKIAVVYNLGYLPCRPGHQCFSSVTKSWHNLDFSDLTVGTTGAFQP